MEFLTWTEHESDVQRNQQQASTAQNGEDDECEVLPKMETLP